MLRDTSAASTSRRSTVSARATAMPASEASSVMMAAAVFITTGALPVRGQHKPPRPAGGRATRRARLSAAQERPGGPADARCARAADDRDKAARNQGNHPGGGGLGGAAGDRARVVNDFHPAYLSLAPDPGELFARGAAGSGGLSGAAGTGGAGALPPQRRGAGRHAGASEEP